MECSVFTLIQSDSGEGVFCPSSFSNALVDLVRIRLGTKIDVEEQKNCQWLGDEKSIFVRWGKKCCKIQTYW
jgi:hypothetical protein